MVKSQPLRIELLDFAVDLKPPFLKLLRALSHEQTLSCQAIRVYSSYLYNMNPLGIMKPGNGLSCRRVVGLSKFSRPCLDSAGRERFGIPIEEISRLVKSTMSFNAARPR